MPPAKPKPRHQMTPKDVESSNSTSARFSGGIRKSWMEKPHNAYPRLQSNVAVSSPDRSSRTGAIQHHQLLSPADEDSSTSGQNQQTALDQRSPGRREPSRPLVSTTDINPLVGRHRSPPNAEREARAIDCASLPSPSPSVEQRNSKDSHPVNTNALQERRNPCQAENSSESAQHLGENRSSIATAAPNRAGNLVSPTNPSTSISHQRYQPGPTNSNARVTTAGTVQSSTPEVGPQGVREHPPNGQYNTSIESPDAPSSPNQYGFSPSDLAFRVAARIQQVANLQGRGDYEIRRLELLDSACRQSDIIYLIIHQIFCWSFSHGSLVSCPFLEGATLRHDRGIEILSELLAPNNGLPVDAVDWFSNFPMPLVLPSYKIRLYRESDGDALECLDHLSRGWEGMQQIFSGFGRPPSTHDIRSNLGIHSVLLQQIAFRTILRRTWVGERDTCLDSCEKLFIKNQQSTPASTPTGYVDHAMDAAFDKILAEHVKHTHVPAHVLNYVQAPRTPQVAQHSPPNTTFHFQSSGSHLGPASRRSSFPAFGTSSAPHNGNLPMLAPVPSSTSPTQMNFPQHLRFSGPQAIPSPVQTHQTNTSNNMTQGGFAAPYIIPTTAQPFQPNMSPSDNAQAQPAQRPSMGNSRRNTSSSFIPLHRNMSQTGSSNAQVHPVAAHARTVNNLGLLSPLEYQAAREAAGDTMYFHGPTPHDSPYMNFVPSSRPQPIAQSQMNPTFGPHRLNQGHDPFISVPPPNSPGALPQIPNPSMTALHQAHAKSPQLIPMDPVDPTDIKQFEWSRKTFRYVHSVRLSNCSISAVRPFQQLKTVLSPEDSRKRAHNIAGSVGLPLRPVTNNSLIFRIKSANTTDLGKFPSKDQWASAEMDWPLAESKWPHLITVQLNGENLEIRRKSHHGKDLTIDVTSKIKEGQNEIEIAVIGIPEQESYVVGLEIVKVIDESHLKALLTTLSYTDARHRLLGRLRNTDPDVEAMQSDIVLDLTDPFTSRLFKVPVRSKTCAHHQCFDLDVFLQTRNAKDTTQPCAPEDFRCPICKGDARPHLLQVDGFYAYLREELVKMGREDVKAVRLSDSGEWNIKEEEEPTGEKGDGNGVRPATTNASGSNTGRGTPMRSTGTTTQNLNVEMIEILDDDDD